MMALALSRARILSLGLGFCLCMFWLGVVWYIKAFAYAGKKMDPNYDWDEERRLYNESAHAYAKEVIIVLAQIKYSLLRFYFPFPNHADQSRLLLYQSCALTHSSQALSRRYAPGPSVLLCLSQIETKGIDISQTVVNHMSARQPHLIW